MSLGWGLVNIAKTFGLPIMNLNKSLELDLWNLNKRLFIGYIEPGQLLGWHSLKVTLGLNLLKPDKTFALPSLRESDPWAGLGVI